MIFTGDHSLIMLLFFFKQKTAYEMRISDWSSDVCSSDLDPCFRVEHHKELNETVVRGLSDLHLRVMLERMRERYGVEVDSHTPRIAYRETIAGHAEGHHQHTKQTSGAGQFGEVFLRLEPLAPGAGFEFVARVQSSEARRVGQRGVRK